MDEGYGLNPAMVNRLHGDGIRLLVTVDNGVAAKEALERAHALEMDVIVTDHHTIPAEPAPMTALLHPATTPEDSPYRGLAGVGMAYVLAMRVALSWIASTPSRPPVICSALAPLPTWHPDRCKSPLAVGRAGAALHRSQAEGIRALQRLAGLGDRRLTSDDIGFQLAPRINAVGQVGRPSTGGRPDRERSR